MDQRSDPQRQDRPKAAPSDKLPPSDELKGIETESATGALEAPKMPPILDKKGSPDIDKR